MAQRPLKHQRVASQALKPDKWWAQNSGTYWHGICFSKSYCWWKESGKLTSWGKGSLSHYLQGFLHPTGGWPWDFWTINSISGPFWRQNHSHLGSMVDAPQPPKKMIMCQVKAISQPITGNKVYVKVSAYVGEFQYFYRPPRPRNKRNQLLFVGIWHWA